MKNIFIFVVLIAFCASEDVYSAGSVTKNIITKIAFQSDHLFVYADNWVNASDCQKSNAVVLQKNDHNFEKAYSLILAAFMSGKTLSGYSDGCIEWDGSTYNTIRGYKYLIVE